MRACMADGDSHSFTQVDVVTQRLMVSSDATISARQVARNMHARRIRHAFFHDDFAIHSRLNRLCRRTRKQNNAIARRQRSGSTGAARSLTGRSQHSRHQRSRGPVPWLRGLPDGIPARGECMVECLWRGSSCRRSVEHGSARRGVPSLNRIGQVARHHPHPCPPALKAVTSLW